MLAGVAGGMAEYLDIDPTVIRILWVIIGIASGGFALIAYVILALLMPQAVYAAAPGAWGPAGAPTAPPAPIGGWDAAAPAGTYPGTYAGSSAGNAFAGTYPGGYTAPAAAYAPAQSGGRGIGIGAIVGVVLVVIGVIALADAALPGWVAGAILGPAVILTLGAALLASSIRRRDDVPQASTAAAQGAPAPYAGAAATAPATSEASAFAPAGDATVTPAAPWDVTDTQSIDPRVAPDTDEGSRPA
jgi:phage shock protein PspC (stress-responsive transcriptional regulator)